MQLYGASLYWHLASTPGDSVAEADADLWRGKSVLEVACMRGGGARFLAEVAGVGAYVATDDFAENIDFCSQAPEIPPNLRFECLPAADLASHFAAGTFDAVLCVEAAAEFVDLPAFLRGASHVLRPGGRLLLCDAFTAGRLKELLDAFPKTTMRQIWRASSTHPACARSTPTHRAAALVWQPLPAPVALGALVWRRSLW